MLINLFYQHLTKEILDSNNFENFISLTYLFGPMRMEKEIST